MRSGKQLGSPPEVKLDALYVFGGAVAYWYALGKTWRNDTDPGALNSGVTEATREGCEFLDAEDKRKALAHILSLKDPEVPGEYWNRVFEQRYGQPQAAGSDYAHARATRGVGRELPEVPEANETNGDAPGSGEGT